MSLSVIDWIDWFWISIVIDCLRLENSILKAFKVAPYNSFTIARAQRKTPVFFDFYDVNMTTKSKTESKFSRVSFGGFF